MNKKTYTIFVSLVVALGGFLLGFDSAVISGATPFYRETFGLNSGSMLIGFSVSSLILGAIMGNIVAGGLADRFGRRRVLMFTALLFVASAIFTAFSFDIVSFIIARVLGGLGVGMAILIAPMYIAEIAPRKLRGTLVTFNQLNIVLGISIAYFSNYYFQQTIADPDFKWRIMLGVEAVPAILYFSLLFFVPRSPRWLIQKGQDAEAQGVLVKIHGKEQSAIEQNEINESLKNEINKEKARWSDVFSKRMKLVLIIGFGIAFFQQITGINAIFYYAPMIFEMAGGGKDAAFMQAAILGVTNVVMTVVAMFLIDRLGRKPLLYIGAAGIFISLAIVGFSFNNAKYTIDHKSMTELTLELKQMGATDIHMSNIDKLTQLKGNAFKSEVSFFSLVKQTVGVDTYNSYKEIILKHSISINPVWVLIGLIMFVASFAISMGPVMWTLLSEIFPNKLRGLAISIMGFWNSIVSFSVATVFPAQLEYMGSSATYFIYSLFGLLTLIFVWRFVPETKGKSLEELEANLIK
ncbi:sugar porter family MFS transporter [Perlabentimonas gracilis]|uniref:sugar porter family MFS transporter n=1 Tax=Perlabentimonas gracilis TaxID=2715279 RepID=UPI00140A962D|nr:sugar porter family MFS transporter [Perlabentimonas gracilis]NHB68098.1 sugar porter family MFS transporter [Perlabentimonas gracilis]